MIREHMKVVSYCKALIDKEFNGKLLMLTVSGSHLYGWESPDSDVDYRGVYIAGTENFLKLHKPKTFNINELVPYDLELKELGHYLDLGISGNCNVLDQLHSKFIYRTPEILEVKQLIMNNITRAGVYGSYEGLARHNYKEFILNNKGQTYKKYLYVIRSLLAGIYVLQTGRVEPNMVELNKYFKLPEVKTLLRHKREGSEEQEVDDLVFSGQLDELISSLMERIDDAYIKSKIPLEREDYEDVNNWLLKKRIQKLGK